MVRAAPADLVEFLRPFDEGVVEIVYRLRDRVLGVMPCAHEVAWDATNAVALGYTPTTRWQDAICHIATYSRHANLGFNQGASLADPLGILVGTGARVRHVSFRSADAVEEPWVADYLVTAMTAGGMTSEMGDSGTTVRVSAGPKRRPRSRSQSS